MILASFSSFLGSVWFGLMLGLLGVGVGVWLCKRRKV
jgi:hypothetical protein